MKERKTQHYKNKYLLEKIEDQHIILPLKPSYLICNTCGRPYLHTRFTDDYYCDACLSQRNRGIGTE